MGCRNKLYLSVLPWNENWSRNSVYHLLVGPLFQYLNKISQHLFFSNKLFWKHSLYYEKRIPKEGDIKKIIDVKKIQNKSQKVINFKA